MVRHTRRIEEVKPVLTYSEIYHQKPTAALVKTLLGRLNKFQFLSFICGVSAIMHGNTNKGTEPQWQLGFARELMPVLCGERVITALGGEPRMLVHELQLGLLARYGLQFCEANATVGDFTDIVLRLLLAVNELWSQVPELDAGGNARRAFFRSEVQSGVLPNERFAHVIQRYYRFFKWCDALPPNAPDRLPIRSDFQRLMSMTPDDYLASAFCVLTHFLSLRSVKDLTEKKIFFSLKMFPSSLKRRDILDSWISRFSHQASDLANKSPEPTFSVSDLAPFIERPLVVFDGDQVFCPLPSLLEDTINTRLYFALFAEYEFADGVEKARQFSRLQGHFLEEYVADLFRILLPANYHQYGEIEYLNGQNKSSDVVAIRIEDGATVFTEVTKTRFRLTESLFAMDDAAIKKDIDSMILRKAKQVQRCVTDLHNGLFSYPEAVTSIAPLIVTGQNIPGLIYLKNWIEEELQSRSLLQSTEPLVYCDIEELEVLSIAAPGTIDLYALLTEKAKHPDLLARAQSLKNYLHYYRPDISHKRLPGETILPGYEEAVTNMIEPAVRSWGFDMTFDKAQLIEPT
jgi:hypothetical protein